MSEQLAQRIQPETPTSPVEEVKGEKSPEIQVGESKIPKPSEYAEIKGKPMVADILNFGEAIDHFNMKELSNEINDFILSEITRSKMQDDKKSYVEVLNSYLKRANLPDGVSIYGQTERLAELMRLDKKLLDIIQAKKQIEEKPIEDLTSEQLKKRMGL